MNEEHNQFKCKVKDLHRLAVARIDIAVAQAACQYIIDNIKFLGDPLYHPHYVTLVICYARPFTRNNLYGALSKKWSKFPNEPAAGMHKQLIDARHTFVAHSDGSVRCLQITPKGHVVRGTKYKIDEYSCQVENRFIALENFPLAKANCQYLVSQMNNEIKELLDYVGPKLDFSKGPVELDVTNLL
jgi:hypothetical protein